MKLTQARLKELLHYDPEVGVFTWRVSRGRLAKAGQVAGDINKIDGYRRILVDRKKYLASRLAWLYMEGYFPEYQVDHENRVRHDNKWENLRHVSPQCNTRNSKISSKNTSGITGISWDNIKQKWRAYIGIMPSKMIYLGRFSSKSDAAMVRWQAEVKYGFPECNTTSTAYLYLQQHTTQGNG